jgi:hypothetical protein
MTEEKTVYTVRMRRVKPSVVARHLEKCGLPVDGPIDEQVKRLVEHVKELVKGGQLPKERLAACDTCGGFSDMMEDECPYCGDAEMSDDSVESAAKQPSVEKPAEKPARTRSQAKADNGKKAAEKPEKKAGPAAKGNAPPGEKMAEEKPLRASKAKKSAGGSKVAVKPAGKSKAADKKAEPAVIETTGETVELAAGLSEKDLDESVGRLAQAAVDTASGLYRYGQELQRIHDTGLWKLRQRAGSKNGGPAYKSFEQFCRDEVKLSRQHAYRLMAVTKGYTEKQLEQYGLSKLHLALQVPEELRSQVLGDGSASTRSMSEAARRLAQGETAARHTPPVPKADKDRAVTVAIVPGITEVPMWKRPTGDWPKGKPTTPATSIKDEPWFRLPLTNDVVLTVRLTRTDKGEILAIVEHRRGKETA